MAAIAFTGANLNNNNCLVKSLGEANFDSAIMQESNKLNSLTIATRQRQLRQSLWPQYSERDLWLRTVRNGFTTIPRTMPLIFQIMDRLSNGRPVSSTYFDIWCRSYDECFIVLNKHQEMAFSAGFSGQRAGQTWQTRVGILAEWEFIGIKSGPSGPLSYAIILNPYKVIEKHYKKHKNLISEDLYNALLVRAIEIGANDLSEQSDPAPVAKTATKKTKISPPA